MSRSNIYKLIIIFEITTNKNTIKIKRICFGFNSLEILTPIGEAIKLPMATGSANENTIKEWPDAFAALKKLL